MPGSNTDLSERLVKLEVFNEKVAEPSLAQILAKLDGLVSESEYVERKKYVDGKINDIEKNIKAIQYHNEKLDGNIFIKAIVTGEKKFVGVIIKYTGLTVLIGAVGLFLLTQFTHLIQDKPTVEVIEKVKEVTK
jgi:hypothetical protein|nr:MAG TPA: hypothetical protein [Caudoviricetes sp.]